MLLTTELPAAKISDPTTTLIVQLISSAAACLQSSQIGRCMLAVPSRGSHCVSGC